MSMSIWKDLLTSKGLKLFAMDSPLKKNNQCDVSNISIPIELLFLLASSSCLFRIDLCLCEFFHFHLFLFLERRTRELRFKSLFFSFISSSHGMADGDEDGVGIAVDVVGDGVVAVAVAGRSNVGGEMMKELHRASPFLPVFLQWKHPKISA